MFNNVIILGRFTWVKIVAKWRLEIVKINFYLQLIFNFCFFQINFLKKMSIDSEIDLLKFEIEKHLKVNNNYSNLDSQIDSNLIEIENFPNKAKGNEFVFVFINY